MTVKRHPDITRSMLLSVSWPGYSELGETSAQKNKLVYLKNVKQKLNFIKTTHKGQIQYLAIYIFKYNNINRYLIIIKQLKTFFT